MKPYTLCIAFWVLFVTIGLAQLIFSGNPDNLEDQLIEEEDGDSWSETLIKNHEAIQNHSIQKRYNRIPLEPYYHPSSGFIHKSDGYYPPSGGYSGGGYYHPPTYSRPKKSGLAIIVVPITLVLVLATAVAFIQSSTNSNSSSIIASQQQQQQQSDNNNNNNNDNNSNNNNNNNNNAAIIAALLGVYYGGCGCGSCGCGCCYPYFFNGTGRALLNRRRRHYNLKQLN